MEDEQAVIGEEGLKLPDGTPLSSLETIQAEMRPGSALFYGGALYHGAGANTMWSR